MNYAEGIYPYPKTINCPVCGTESKVFSEGNNNKERYARYSCPNPNCPDRASRLSGLFIGWRTRDDKNTKMFHT